MNSSKTNRDLALNVATPPLPTGSTLWAASRGRTFQQAMPMALALFLVAFALPLASAQSYLPTDIVVPAGDAFRADAMNDLGQVSGAYTPAGGLQQPVVWANGAFTQLPLLSGANAGWARGLNNNGQVVGACRVLQVDGQYLNRACIWENGTVQQLPSVPGTHWSAAWAINNAGTILGHVYTLNGSSYRRDAVVYSGNVVAKLTPPEAGSQTWARAIDDSGQVAATWGEEYQGQGWVYWHQAARWTPNVPNGTAGTMTGLGGVQANDINNAGIVCGIGGNTPYVWEDLSGLELPINGIDYAIWGTANSINDAGVVLGDLTDDFMSPWAPFVSSVQGGAWNLNTLLAASCCVAWQSTMPVRSWFKQRPGNTLC